MDANDLISIAEAAKLLPGRLGGTIHASTVWRWIRTGRLASWRVGRSRYVSRADVLAAVEPVEVETRPAAVGTRAAAKWRAERDRLNAEVLGR